MRSYEAKDTLIFPGLFCIKNGWPLLAKSNAMKINKNKGNSKSKPTNAAQKSRKGFMKYLYIRLRLPGYKEKKILSGSGYFQQLHIGLYPLANQLHHPFVEGRRVFDIGQVFIGSKQAYNHSFQ